jgi:hypothetical protein
MLFGVYYWFNPNVFNSHHRLFQRPCIRPLQPLLLHNQLLHNQLLHHNQHNNWLRNQRNRLREDQQLIKKTNFHFSKEHYYIYNTKKSNVVEKHT